MKTHVTCMVSRTSGLLWKGEILDCCPKDCASPKTHPSFLVRENVCRMLHVVNTLPAGAPSEIAEFHFEDEDSLLTGQLKIHHNHIWKPCMAIDIFLAQK